MRRTATTIAVALIHAILASAVGAQPLKLHPDNPHYLWFDGKPAVLITSGEHYGAVLNTEFDYGPYLDELKAHTFNLTRTFAGTYREVPGSFKIVDNTLAPAPGKYLCPWARSDVPGAADGGNKFDLARWDGAYFKRLKDFIAQAGKRGIVVELVLFCTFYDDALWKINPMNTANNVNDVEAVGREQVFTPKNVKLVAFHDALVRKIATELRDADNLYYEVCNEPYFAGVTREWQEHIIATLVDAETKLPHRHLIAQNIANGAAKIEKPNKHVSIFNFHYATPPTTVGINYALDRVIGDDETGFKGTGDFAYRSEAWDFVIAGGAIYSNLDYSFTPKHPDGTFKVTTSPGGGGQPLRKQLAILKRFIEGFELVRMAPHNEVIAAGIPAKATARCLAEPGKAYAIYIKGGTQAKLKLTLPAGTYTAEWLDTQSGAVTRTTASGELKGAWELQSPEYREDIAMRIRPAR
jgi:hypothetical protein